ncbi:histone acetyltransferase 1 [Vermiconidia calcicola]|uniref:Histone acetyltransferase 1 n=1 Tax=Vermiconidia calcicola TaxID=1690605 RepID=A0ACC3NJH8_9PEZI|nr:histone acetyltransferase 1 [Vermiconidia calcicola]
MDRFGDRQSLSLDQHSKRGRVTAARVDHQPSSFHLPNQNSHAHTSSMDAEMDNEELEAQIQAQVEEWSTNSNECFTIDIVRGDGSKAATFQPAFTYTIFGEEEAIFGYQALSIRLAFAAHDLRPHVNIKYDHIFPATGEVRPTDIKEALKDFLPESALASEGEKDALRDKEASQFVPPGEKVHEYARDGQQYEIWCSTLLDPKAKKIVENVGILVPMLIEGGTTLQIEQDWTTQRWKLFLLYNIREKPEAGPAYSKYSLAGYGTSYRVFTFPDRHDAPRSDLDIFSHSSQSLNDFLQPPETDDSTPTAKPNSIASPLDLPSRERLSQFLILPTFQRGGHGQELYNTMYTTLTKPPNIREFTIEDPNEAFDDLRDQCDLLYLRHHVPEFAALRINTNIPADKFASATAIPTDLIVPLTTREAIMKQTKISQRQFDRVVEMHTLSFIPPANRSRSRLTRKEKASNENDKAYYFWRMYAKQRLYIFNRDQLAQLEREERIEKLEAALDSVLESYAMMLERVAVRENSPGAPSSPAAVEGATHRKRLGKRKVIDDEDEEEVEVIGNGQAGGDVVTSEGAVNGHGNKKLRVD